MTLRWTVKAEQDLSEIVAYMLRNESPMQAERIARELGRAPTKLVENPYIGRLGNRPWTRELVLSPLPYIIVYTITKQTIRVLRIFHGRQNWKA